MGEGMDLAKNLGDGVVAFFSSRDVDFTLPDCQPVELSSAQTAYLARQSVPAHFPVAQIHQIHGDRIVEVSTQDFPWAVPFPDADALITRSPQIGLMVRTADCLPVFLYDPVRRTIGLIHAGWRSTQKRIVAQTLDLLHGRWGTNPQDIRVVLGPAIRLCCYEVGEEFRKNFPAEVSEREGRRYFDLAAVNRRQLQEGGVLAQHIHDTRQCTCCAQQFFSFRREGAKAGRHLSFLAMTSPVNIIS